MAIAFDSSAAATASTGGSANTWSHTCNGSNRLLIVVFTGPPDSGSYTGNACTYNGVSMTEVGHTAVDNSTGDWYVSMWYLINPASGTNTISFTGSNNLSGSSASYTGVKQTGQPDGSAVLNSGGSSVASKTFTNTVTASNCWQILGLRTMVQVWSAGSGTLLRQNGYNTYNQIYDSNGTVGTGSQSLIASGTSDKVGGIIASFAPVVSSTLYTLTASPATFTFTGQTDGNSKHVYSPASPAVYSFTGISAMLNRKWTITTFPATFLLTGLNISFSLREWTKQVKSSAATWLTETKSGQTNNIIIGNPIGLLLALTYATNHSSGSSTIWTKQIQSSSTWTKQNKS
jgi:hypothetical protein